ncbi:beta-1,3-galactosyltransferase 1 isoform X2 [Strigops habroptila]|uniref:beta-1,3-galactosyltransferase 1 isoform X2 n=1 Tax=Strigops habroptila TaxID=2489341 RepID=UPI0011CF262B|nr:beta-1,3-galactosyltransferase 1 isoform X2 [Strigops habroptila]XP_030342481.1 beta-1,3-galactosyltransferase 1 isoform X2 [Strigops habroptila]
MAGPQPRSRLAEQRGQGETGPAARVTTGSSHHRGLERVPERPRPFPSPARAGIGSAQRPAQPHRHRCGLAPTPLTRGDPLLSAAPLSRKQRCSRGELPLVPCRHTFPPPRCCAGGDWLLVVVSRRGRVPPVLGLRTREAGTAAARRGGWCGCRRSSDAGCGAACGSGRPARSGVRPGGRGRRAWPIVHSKIIP